MTLKECSDATIIGLWQDPINQRSYAIIYSKLYHTGYDCTVHTVRRRIKKTLHRHRMVPRRPTQNDYMKSSQAPGTRADDLN